jgi:hypothetical protein
MRTERLPGRYGRIAPSPTHSPTQVSDLAHFAFLGGWHRWGAGQPPNATMQTYDPSLRIIFSLFLIFLTIAANSSSLLPRMLS